MRSLSMRIANPHLLTKKSRFISYPTKKNKDKLKTKFLTSDNEIGKALIPNATVIQNDPVTTDHQSLAIQNDNLSMAANEQESSTTTHLSVNKPQSPNALSASFKLKK